MTSPLCVLELCGGPADGGRQAWDSPTIPPEFSVQTHPDGTKLAHPARYVLRVGTTGDKLYMNPGSTVRYDFQP
jgi:hypothetical protein